MQKRDELAIVVEPKHAAAEAFRLLRANLDFVRRYIFPGGQVPSVDDIVEHSRNAGLSLGTTQLMNPHYVRTLDIWAANLQQHRDDATATTSVEVYERYLRYLTGCADFFRRGITEVAQFAFTKE